MFTWEQVDFDRAVISVVRSKSDSIRHISKNKQLTESIKAVKLIAPAGEVAEWTKAAVSKTASRVKRDVGSNPTLSAILVTV